MFRPISLERTAGVSHQSGELTSFTVTCRADGRYPRPHPHPHTDRDLESVLSKSINLRRPKTVNAVCVSVCSVCVCVSVCLFVVCVRLVKCLCVFV